MVRSATKKLQVFCAEHLDDDVRAALSRLSRAEDVQHVAAMPDVHLAQEVCIGTVVATTRTLYPAAVGGDIGCGMAAIGLDGTEAHLCEPAAADQVLEAFAQAVPIARLPARTRLPESLASLSAPTLEKKRSKAGAEQLGTLGSGNHFLEIQVDAQQALWLMVHSGSRAMGQAIRDHHLQAATRRRGGLYGLDVDAEAGQRYLSDLDWALKYAAENRRRILSAAVDVLTRVLGIKPKAETFFACHHNHVRHERVGDRRLWVHRKGAISARAGEPGIIPGSMGTESFHVVGKGCPASLNSSSHGAGRAMSRTVAHRRISVDALRADMRGIWFDQRLAHRLRDEAPAAYKDVGKVMKAQRRLTKIVRRLRPLLVYKGA